MSELLQNAIKGVDEYGQYMDVEICGVTQRFRWIPPGDFLMGSPEDEPGRFADETQHPVSVEGFWLADTACTQELWEAVMGNNPSFFKGNDRPVEQVSWYDSQRFTEKLHEITQATFRLPTEEEWEYACRAGRSTAFWFGDTITTDEVNFNGNYQNEQYRGETVGVKELPCNGWGLYQMHGNVWEWCSNEYQEYR